MGSKSSKNKSTGTNAAQMAALQKANPAPTMEEAMGNQQSMQSSLLEQIMPVFGAMMQMGQDSMDNNPMLKAFGPTSDGEKSTLQDMIAALTPQQPQVGQPVPMPQWTSPDNSVPLPQTTPDRASGFGGFSAGDLEHLRGAMNRRNGFTGNQ